MGDGQDLVLLLLEGLLNLVQLRAVSNRCLELGCLDAVGLKAVCEAVGEVAGVQDEGLVAPLRQVDGNLVPAECTRTADHERLAVGVGGLEELPEHGQGLAEAVDERNGGMRLAVVAHGLEDLIVVLNRTRDEHGRVRRLARHVDWFFFLLFWFGFFFWLLFGLRRRGGLGTELAALVFLDGGMLDVVAGTAVPFNGEGRVQRDVGIGI